MAISLTKGQNVSLSKTDPSLKNVLVGLGWDARSTDGQDFDLDASVFMATENAKVPSDSYFIFYNQLVSPCGGVEHTGDNLTGDGDGDDESVIVRLDKVESNIKSLFITVTIHDAEEKLVVKILVKSAMHSYVLLIMILVMKLFVLIFLKITVQKQPWYLVKFIAITVNGNSVQ